MSDEEGSFLRASPSLSVLLTGANSSTTNVCSIKNILDRPHWRSMARLAQIIRQMVERLPPVPALNTVRAMGRDHGRLDESGAVRGALQMIDSTVIRAYHKASGLKEASRQRLRRSIGGFTSKIHLLSNAHGLPMNAEITTGQTSDYDGFDLLMADNLPQPSVLLADCAFDGDSIAACMETQDPLPGR